MVWKLKEVITDLLRCYLIVHWWLFSTPITLIGIYVPNANQTLFFGNDSIQRQNIEASHVIMLGGFNAVSSSELDRSRKTNSPTILGST